MEVVVSDGVIVEPQRLKPVDQIEIAGEMPRGAGELLPVFGTQARNRPKA